MIYVYREAASDSARALATALGGKRVRRLPAFRRGDRLVMWGEHAAGIQVPTLNNVAVLNKFNEARKLQAAGVSVVQVAERPPVQNAVEEVGPRPGFPFRTQFGAPGNLTEEEARRLAAALQEYLAAPLPRRRVEVAQWLPRVRNHIGGLDLLTPPARPDFYTKKEDIRKEFRVHSFLGRSIGAAMKIPRPGMQAHPWVRSWDGGWRMHYGDENVRQRHRDIAHEAVKALGLDFGAVDIGERADRSLIVLEVNRAPGIEGSSVESYKRAIAAWAAA